MKILSFYFPEKKYEKRIIVILLPIPISMSSKVHRFCFIVKDPLDQSDCRIPESLIFHERVEV